MTYVKKSHAKRNLAIILIIIICVASAAVAYATLTARKIEVGVKVGDTFTYSIKGYVELAGLDATMTDGFEMYNATDYFKVTITALNGTQVTLDTLWRFQNGTEIPQTQTIDLANGLKSDENGFWAIYAANLNKADLLRPAGHDGYVVNNTDTTTYTSGQRGRCSWHIENQFSDMNDPTGSTLMYDYLNIFFDKPTGMLTSLSDIRVFNSPQKQETTEWKLIASSVWEV